jgi:uncharacterized membrane protein
MELLDIITYHIIYYKIFFQTLEYVSGFCYNKNMDNFYTPLDNKVIKSNARDFIRGRLWMFWSVLLVVGIIESLANSLPQWIFGDRLSNLSDIIAGNPDNIPKEISSSVFGWYYVLNVLITIVLIPLNIGVAQNVLAWSRGEDVNKWKVLFGGFNSAKIFFKQVGVVVLNTILCALWAILLIVPGIIKGLAYSMYPYVLRDEPDLSVWQTLKKSEAIMKGYKGKLFLMYLSFVGWFILGAFTFGILYIWLTPYVMTSTVKFYDDVRRAYYNGNDPARPAFSISSDEENTFGNNTL